MTSSQTYRIALIAIAGFLLTATFHTRVVAQANSPQGVRNIVIVHGAWADGSSWSKVISLLQAKGLHVVAVFEMVCDQAWAREVRHLRYLCQ